jgi:hypothetical protein
MKKTKKNRPCSLNSAVQPLPPASPSLPLPLPLPISLSLSLSSFLGNSETFSGNFSLLLSISLPKKMDFFLSLYIYVYNLSLHGAVTETRSGQRDFGQAWPIRARGGRGFFYSDSMPRWRTDATSDVGVRLSAMNDHRSREGKFRGTRMRTCRAW